MSISVGEQAPNVTLHASTEEEISLVRHKGDRPTVLLFFPLAFSPVCTNELIAMRDDYDNFENLGAAVMAVSVDSQFTLGAWGDQLELPFPLLSDFNREASEAYGVLYEDFFGLEGVSKRAAFVVDPAGEVAWAWVTEDADDLPPFEEILEAVAEAR